ncbi:hypothetical protein FHT09_000786 [Xanthomonas arboricola]|nr:hypothetical protein [Xanthomonas sp. CFBP 8152]
MKRVTCSPVRARATAQVPMGQGCVRKPVTAEMPAEAIVAARQARAARAVTVEKPRDAGTDAPRGKLARACSHRVRPALCGDSS